MSETPADKMPKTVLLVEDDPNDEMMERRALNQSWPNLKIEVARHGGEATKMLFEEENGAYDLIILDIKLPLRSGIELLEDIRGDERFRRTPVVMLTSSSELSDVERCYRLGANSFVQKALDYKHFMRSLGLCADYWLSVNVAAH